MIRLDYRKDNEVESPIVLSIGRKCGDIPLFNLKNTITMAQRKPTGFSEDINALFFNLLRKQNEQLKKTKCINHRCLTGFNVISALINTEKLIGMKKNQIEQKLVNKKSLKGTLTILQKQEKVFISFMKDWLLENFFEIVYVSRVPGQIIDHLKNCLEGWGPSSINYFNEDIEKMVITIARKQGIATAHADYAWEKMGGGRIF